MTADWGIDAGRIAEMALAFFAAVIAGGLIGWERERHDKPAGLRTHMLVALGSAIFATLGLELQRRLADDTGTVLDPTRVLHGIIGGIGFIGAGAIIRTPREVTGLTTATSVWLAAALGTACGLGLYAVAALGAVFGWTVLRLVESLKQTVHEEHEQESPERTHSQPGTVTDD